MTNQLVITAIGEDQPGLVDQLSKNILEYSCNIADSRMMVLGGEFAILILVEGSWNAIAKLEDHLAATDNSLDLQITVKRTATRKRPANSLPYSVDVIALDHPGIVHELARFFSHRTINIHDLSTSSYAAAHTGSPMFSVHIMLDIPEDVHIAGLREEFQAYCDQLNLDACIEPAAI
ncbi:MAG: ACT domain-containing protein [Gammaproteobacteria bacterium]